MSVEEIELIKTIPLAPQINSHNFNSKTYVKTIICFKQDGCCTSSWNYEKPFILY